MNIKTSLACASLALLAACAGTGHPPPDFAAQQRPLEERCVRAQKATRSSEPGRTQAEVQAQAKIAASRGELDKACDWL